MDELEKRGLVGPARGAEPREILFELPPENLSGPDDAEQPPESTALEALADEAESKSTSIVGDVTVPRDSDVALVSDLPASEGGSETPPSSAAAEDVPPEAARVTDDDAPLAVNLPEPSLQALRWFYERLTVTPADATKLWVDRGLTAATVEALGFKSNPQSNKELLLEMEQCFPLAVLLDCGLWTTSPTDPTAKPHPNAQYYGMSLVEKRDPKTGKKVRDKYDKPVIEFVWNNAILIPYFDEAGELIHLRPHKGMMRDKTPRLYVARSGKAWRKTHPNFNEEPKPNYALITEGEFKAAALWQVCGWRVAVAAMPGITMARTVQSDVEEWLSLPRVAVQQVVVGYDNEDKSNPKLPGYIGEEEEWKGYEVTVWARLLARLLGKEGWDARVMQLPNSWRNANGKADWDGRLAQRLEEARLAHRLDGAELWKKVGETIRLEFEAEIKKARPVYELFQAGFFDSKAEREIQKRLTRLLRDPALPIGGDAEVTISRRLHRLCKKLRDVSWFPAKNRGFLHLLAKQYADLKGGYYVFKPIKDKNLEEWQALKVRAADSAAKDVERACDLALQGVPQRISDFYLKAHYVLKRGDGTRQRLVTLHNIHGVSSGLLALPSEPFSAPTKFRHWLLDNIAGATWKAGERELNDLQADVAGDVSSKDVTEIAQRGYHKESRCWFYGDVTYDPQGREVFADKHGIIWIRHRAKTQGEDGEEEKEVVQAYKLATRDHEGQTLRHGEPLMGARAKQSPAEVDELFAGLPRLFEEYTVNMFQTIGSHAAHMLIGTILSSGAGPEIYAKYSGFPGLWVHGEPRQGKSSVGRWAMSIWGEHVEKGMPLEDSTKAGLGIALQQYGNLWVWLEEYQPTAPKWMTEKIKNIYGREAGTKKTFDEGDREVLSAALVTGVATSADAQLRSRYVHVQVAAKNRRGDHYRWFEDNRKRFALLGRYIMRNRERFAQLTLQKLEEWLNLPELRNADSRARIVHGVAFAALWALAEMLGVKAIEQDIESYRHFLLCEVVTSIQEVDEQTIVHQFWQDLFTAFLCNQFGKTANELSCYFKVLENKRAVSPVSAEQRRMEKEYPHSKWFSYLLFIQPGPVIAILREYKRSQGRDFPLDKSDLCKQMATYPYWLPQPKGGNHKQRFNGSPPLPCWGFIVDLHPSGYSAVADEDFLRSLKVEQDLEGLNLPSSEWMDPRKGALFAIINLLTS